MATIHYQPVSEGTDAGVSLCSAQAGNGDSTNVMDRGSMVGGGAVQISNTGGATPTVTVNILGSFDGTNWFNLPYYTAAAPGTIVVSAITLTATANNIYWLPLGYAWRYLKLNFSANTNETLTAIAWSR